MTSPLRYRHLGTHSPATSALFPRHPGAASPSCQRKLASPPSLPPLQSAQWAPAFAGVTDRASRTLKVSSSRRKPGPISPRDECRPAVTLFPPSRRRFATPPSCQRKLASPPSLPSLQSAQWAPAFAGVTDRASRAAPSFSIPAHTPLPPRPSFPAIPAPLRHSSVMPAKAGIP